MKTVVDYLIKNKRYEHDVMDRNFELQLWGANILLTHDGNTYLIEQSTQTENIIQEILEEKGIEIRFCVECGIPFDAGFMEDGWYWYSCENCFETAMDNRYGKGKWRTLEDKVYDGGYYEYQQVDGTWENTGIFYTEWY